MYIGLFEMIVGALTTCHTQYTWDSSVCTGLFEMIDGDVEMRVDVCRITKGAHIEHL